jgi:hypothetical protein
MVTLEPVVEEEDQSDDEDHLVTIVQFDDDGDAIMTDAWALDEISTIPVYEEEGPNGIFDFSLISEYDLDDDVVPPTPTSVGDATTVPSMAVSFASAVPDSVQMVAALVPATLPEPTVPTPVASVTTTGLPRPVPIIAAVPPKPTALSVPSAPVAQSVVVAALVPATLPEFPITTAAVPPPAPTAIMSDPSVPSTAVPFAMLAVPPDDSVHLVVSPIRIYPSEAIRSPRHRVASNGRVSAPPILRRSARLAAKNAMRNSMGTIFINGRRRSACLLASRALSSVPISASRFFKASFPTTLYCGSLQDSSIILLLLTPSISVRSGPCGVTIFSLGVDQYGPDSWNILLVNVKLVTHLCNGRYWCTDVSQTSRCGEIVHPQACHTIRDTNRKV